MKSNYLRGKYFLFFMTLLLCQIANNRLYGQQSTISTASTFLNNNGSGTVVFNIQNTNSYPIIITSISGVLGVSGSRVVELYYNTTPVNGTPGQITVANGWNLAASANITGVANTSTTTLQTFLTGSSLLVIPANTTYGIAVYADGQRYYNTLTTWPDPTSYSAGGVNLLMGTNVSYGGGTPPVAPSNHPRGWIGSITFESGILGNNNAGIGSLISPVQFCAGSHSIEVEIINGGKNLISNVDIHWELDGVAQTTIAYSTPIDTAGSIGGNTAQVTLGTHNFTGGPVQLKVWTSNPNGVADTVNGNDTLYQTLMPSLSGTYTIDQSSPASATNFISFTSFAAALNTYGVCGPVIANVATGTGPYNEIVTVGAIPGASTTNTIRLNGNGEQLSFNSTGTTDHRIFTLNGTKYFTLNNLHIKALNANYGWGVHITGAAQFDSIVNCYIDLTEVTSTSSSNTGGIVMSGSTTSPTTGTTGASDIYILNNHVEAGGSGAGGGYYGIVAGGTSSSNNALRVFINGNELSNFYYYGIDARYIENGEISHNDIHRSNKTAITACYAIRTNYGINLRVEGNRIHDLADPSTNSTSSLYGIYAYYTKNSIYANNAIYNLGNYTSSQYLIYPYYTDDCKFYYNTINADVASGTSTSAMYGLYVYYGTNADVKNNIVNITGGNAGTKYGIYVTPAANTAKLQRNNVYINSTQSGTQTPYYWGAAYATLAAFQAAFPTQELGSLSINPAFTAPTSGNLTPTAVPLLTNGLDLLAFVTKDINGIPRTPTPTVGAFQRAASGTDNAGVLSLVELNNAFCSGLQDVNVVIANNGVNLINTVTVNWEVNGVAQTSFSYTGPLDIIGSTSGNLDSVVIGQYNFPAGIASNLKIWTSNPNGNVDADNADDTLYVTVQPADFTAALVSDTICLGDSITVNLIVNGGSLQNAGIQWDSSLDGIAFTPITGATGLSYSQTNLIADAWYRGEVTLNGNTCLTDTAVVRVMNPQVTSVVHDTICGIGTATLSATGSGNGGFSWYANATGGSSIGLGTSFTTPLLTATDTFYVAANSSSNGGLLTGGKATYSAGQSSGSGTTNFGLVFDVLAPVTLERVTIYPVSSTGSSGVVIIDVIDANGNVLHSKTENVVGAPLSSPVPHVVNLGFNLLPGTNLKLRPRSMTGISGLLFDPSGSGNYAYPYNIGGVINILHSTLTAAPANTQRLDLYYYFYNLEIKTGCESPRQMVTANVTAPPAITAAVTQNTICKGSTTNLSATSTNPGYTYNWQPVNLPGATLTVTPDTTTEYIVWAEDLTTGPAAGCITADTILVTVDSIAQAQLVATADTICGGEQVTINRVYSLAPGGFTGTYTGDYSNPFYHLFGGVKSQYVLLASDIISLGGTAGMSISELTMHFTNVITTASFAGFSMNIGHTTQTNSSTIIATGLQNIYNSAAYTPVLGDNTFNFSQNFVWDGTSNIVIQLCWSNNNSGTNANTPTIRYINTSYVSTSYYRGDNLSISTICGGTTPTGTLSRMPWVKFTTTSSNNSTKIWTPGNVSGDTLVVAPTNYGSSAFDVVYTYTETGTNSCTASTNYSIHVNPQPTATIVSNSTVICTNDNGGFYIDASSSLNANTYLWLIDNSTAPSYHVTAAGTYILEVENAAGCSDRDTLVITSVTPIMPTITVNYQGSQATLDAGAGFSDYLWNTLDTTQTIVVTSSGQYSVTVTDNNGCKATSAPVNLGIGVNELDKVQLSLFPNPNKGHFTLSIDDYSYEDLRIDIYDVSGRIIYNQILKEVQSNMKIPMDMSHISEGVYMLKVSSNTSTKTLRFTIVK